MVFRMNLQLFSVILTFFFPYWNYSREKAGCIFFPEKTSSGNP